jgi:ribosomal protein S18 acetylase RimI-like enzyme
MTDKLANLLTTVSPGTEDHIDACLAVARELPQYFTEQGIVAMSQDLTKHLLYVARNLNEVLGFAAVNRKSSRVAELSWIAVKPEHHHQGIGSKLMDRVVDDLRSQEIRVLEVKTLSADVDYPPYEKTRRFYEKNGFMHLDTIDPYPGWEPGNPCAIYVKIL